MVSYDIVFSEEAKKAADQMGFNIIFTDQDLKIVKGGSLEKNRKAVRSKIDLLLDPTTNKGLEFDSAVAQVAHDNNVAVGFSLDSMISQGDKFPGLLRNIKFAVKLCLKKKADIVIITGAKDKYGVRTPKDLIAIGELLGLTRPQAVWAISEVLK
jgi:ribonuclease P/MRP protein subunit RPP1